MTPLIDINLDDTPDDILPISAGVRTFDVMDVRQETDNKNRDYIVADLEVNEPENDEHGRKTSSRFYLQFAPARVNFKRFVKACGGSGTGTGIDPADLIGCTCKAVVKTSTYEEQESGETRERSNVDRFMFDEDDDD